MKIKNLLKNIILSLVIILLCFIIMELILEQIIPPKPTALVPNTTFEYVGGITKLEPVQVSINSFGIRDYEYPLEKSENTYRIIVLGDSLTFGEGVPIEKTYPKQLESKLNSMGLQKRFEVLNFGMHGYNTKQELELLKNKGLQFNPDMVILGICMNDYENLEKVETGLLGLIGRFLERLGNFDTARWARMKILFMQQKEYGEKNIPNFWGIVQPSLEEIYSITKQNNSKLMLVLHSHPPMEEHMTGNLTNFAKERNLALVDMNKVFLEYPFKSIILNEKDIHPNSLAHEIIANSIFEELSKEFLKSRD